MTNQNPHDVTLGTVHEALTGGFADLKGEMTDLKGEMREGFADLKAEVRGGFTDLKATLVAGFRSLPSRESSEEMVRLLREGNRLQEERFTRIDLRSREQHLETQQVLHAVVEGQRLLIEGQRLLTEGQRALADEVRSLAGEIKALIARIDALIRGRGDGGR